MSFLTRRNVIDRLHESQAVPTSTRIDGHQDRFEIGNEPERQRQLLFPIRKVRCVAGIAPGRIRHFDGLRVMHRTAFNMFGENRLARAKVQASSADVVLVLISGDLLSTQAKQLANQHVMSSPIDPS